MSQSQDAFQGDTENSVITQASYNLILGSAEGTKKWWDRCDKGTMRKIVISVVEKYWVGQRVFLDFSIKCYRKTPMYFLANPICMPCYVISERKKRGVGENVANSSSILANGFSSVQFRLSVVSDSLRPQESQHTKPPCASPNLRVHLDSCPSSQ